MIGLYFEVVIWLLSEGQGGLVGSCSEIEGWCVYYSQCGVATRGSQTLREVSDGGGIL